MNNSPKREVLQIKKYPNRRYYDATRSCHVTLHEVYDLILAGHDVVIADSRTGEDITNLVLLQVLLEKDQPKLDLFPATVLHLMIRSNRQVVRTFVERTYGPFMKMLATSQKQWDTYWRQALSGKMVSPLDWANSMMSAFGEGREPESPPMPEGFPEHWPSEEAEHDKPAERAAGSVDELRDQVSALTQRLETLTSQLSEKKRSNNSTKRGKESANRH